MIKNYRQQFIKLIPIFHFLILVLLNAVAYYKFRPNVLALGAGIHLSIDEFVMTYYNVLFKEKINKKQDKLFNIISGIYSVLGLVILFIVFFVKHEIYDDSTSYFTFTALLISLLMSKFVKRLYKKFQEIT